MDLGVTARGHVVRVELLALSVEGVRAWEAALLARRYPSVKRLARADPARVPAPIGTAQARALVAAARVATDAPASETVVDAVRAGGVTDERAIAVGTVYTLAGLADAVPSDLRPFAIGRGAAARIIAAAAPGAPGRAASPPTAAVEGGYGFVTCDRCGADRVASPDGDACPWCPSAWCPSACVVCTRRVTWNRHAADRPLCSRCDTGTVLDRKHGRLAAALAGCRCKACLDAVVTVRGWVDRRVAGETGVDIAAGAGVSPRIVIGRTLRLEPSAPWVAAATERRVLADEVSSSGFSRRCDVCGQPRDRRGRTCSDRCGRVASVLHYHVDEGRRRRSRLETAAWVVAHASTVPDETVRNARRALAGDAADRDARRLVPGTTTFDTAVMVVAERWPIASRLPDDVRRQATHHLTAVDQGWGAVLTADVLHGDYVVEGLSPAQVARRHGVPPAAVWDALERHRIPLREPRPDPDAVLTGAFLRREHRDNRRSASDIADDVGTTYETVRDALDRHGVHQVSSSKTGWGPVLTEAFLRREFVDEGRSAADIASDVGCAPGVVFAWLERHGLRDPADDTDADAASARDGGDWDVDWLREQYLARGRTARDIAAGLGVPVTTVVTALYRHGITRHLADPAAAPPRRARP